MNLILTLVAFFGSSLTSAFLRPLSSSVCLFSRLHHESIFDIIIGNELDTGTFTDGGGVGKGSPRIYKKEKKEETDFKRKELAKQFWRLNTAFSI